MQTKKTDANIHKHQNKRELIFIHTLLLQTSYTIPACTLEAPEDGRM
jgi:hypothetical protein